MCKIHGVYNHNSAHVRCDGNVEPEIVLYMVITCVIWCTGKPHGLRTARKLRNHRRDQKWHDKDYKKSHLGTRWKSNPFGGASHAKGIVLEKVYALIANYFMLISDALI